MEGLTSGSLDGSRQNNSDLMIVLRKLIEAHGADAVKRALRSIEAATPVENPRSRGRPAGPAIDDLPSLREAAAIWRQRGGGPVWPALIAVAESLPGETESNARRLLGRLSSTGRGWGDQFERAGIGDFWFAAWDRKLYRVLTRAGPRYKKAFYTAILTAEVQNPNSDFDPELIDILRRGLPPLTYEDIVILTQDSPTAKIFPWHLISSGSAYYLVFGRLAPLDSSSR
jgi:hypothetical protein